MGGSFLMKKKRIWIWLLLTLLWIGLIFWHSSRNAVQSDGESLDLLCYIQKILPWMTNNLLRKLAHFGEFAVLGLLLTGTFYNAKGFRLLKPIFFGLLTALCDETIQLFVPGRSGNVRDLWIDLSGVAVGTLFLWLIYKLRKKR